MSIISAKEVVLRGSRWRIGNEEHVRIWNDNWLPLNPGFKPIGTVHNVGFETKVSEIMDCYLVLWKKEKVQELFWRMDAKQILSIPYH